MNYLAHLFLSFRDPELMLGNFIADVTPKQEYLLLAPRIRAGVDLHRKIDKFTDVHDSFKLGVRSLRKHHRKYAPVVLDILNDHLLSKNWNDYSNESLLDFEDFVYKSFIHLVDSLPPKAKRHTDALLEYQYLKAYRSKAGLQDVLRRMDLRARFSSDFRSASAHLYDQYDLFDGCFNQLFKDLLLFTGHELPGDRGSFLLE